MEYCIDNGICLVNLEFSKKTPMESWSVKLIFWNRKARPLVSACDAVARDLEHFIFKVNIYVTTNHC